MLIVSANEKKKSRKESMKIDHVSRNRSRLSISVDGAIFPDFGSLLTRKDTLPKSRPLEAVVATCSSTQTRTYFY